MARHFLTGEELSAGELSGLLERAAELKADRLASRALDGMTVALIFEKPSTRTRFSFEVGVRELGGHAVVVREGEMQLARGESVTVFGDGEQTRDYTHVHDVVQSNLLAAGSDASGAFNVGTGVQATVIDLVDALNSIGERQLVAEHAPERPGEVRHIALDCTRAREELGWKSKVGLRDGLEQTLGSLG